MEDEGSVFKVCGVFVLEIACDTDFYLLGNLRARLGHKRSRHDSVSVMGFLFAEMKLKHACLLIILVSRWQTEMK